ncbi:hypothetical protein HELRODRAFT_181039 [Helobdella robusta]|uniref:SUEL-type lectin domain-containing protein n=1 Tax=Helobdella robusta TaxID=6412 RepID=T1FGJ8_HELRO|nr:hypothetical protein HELRODRAFT_181039 [Helobdella robusta]ESN93293.1 hypothetical protein HELRODRAFT_181039 [Helobdella robusta]
MELLNITCPRQDDLILVSRARYGRMLIGRCVQGQFGHVGCFSDVIGYLDGKCSGRKECHFQVPDQSLYDLQPCPVDFTSYLEVTYSCITEPAQHRKFAGHFE